MRTLLVLFLLFSLSACASSDEKFMGFWQEQGMFFSFFKIEKNGSDLVLKEYKSSRSDGSLETEEYPLTIDGNKFSTGEWGINGFYKEDNTLVTGSNVYDRVSEEVANKAIQQMRNAR